MRREKIMKKTIILTLITSICVVGLSSCIQVNMPAPQQPATVVETTIKQTQMQQQVAPVETAPAPAPTMAQQQMVPIQPQQVNPAQGNYQMPQFAITLEQAKEIAVRAVGMSVSNVTFTKQKQDYDDGMPEYEIEFVVNNMEYEFEISGVNGAILKQEVDSVFD